MTRSLDFHSLSTRPGPRKDIRGAQSPRLRTVTDFGSNPGNLAMKLFASPALPERAPLVVVLHGCTQTAEGYAAGAGWLALAERYGFAVLCPEQSRSNNPNLCFNWFQADDTARSAGEAASIHAMVQWSLDHYGVDRDQVFVTGLSAGGAMTAVMLATYPEVFAGGAVIAGLAYGSANSIPEAFGAMTQASNRTGADWGDRVRDTSTHRGPWPTISIWHGTGDATVRPTAGEALLKQWLDVHEIRGGPEPAATSDGRSYEVWKTPEGRPVVEMHRIEGMAHGTPLKTGGAEGHGTAGAYLLEVGVGSSLEIARTWGIARTQRATARPEARTKAQAERGRRELVPTLVAPAPVARPVDPITAVIEGALRTAGLMR